MIRTLLLLLFFSFSFQVISASPTFYAQNSNLYLPEVKIDDQLYSDIYIKLNANGAYSIAHFETLDSNEQEILTKINTCICGPSDTLGKFSAKKSFDSGDKNYCLAQKPFTGTDPGSYQYFLFIENGTIEFAVDKRTAMYEADNFSSTTNYTDLKFGYMDGDIFVEVTSLEQIDFEKIYILQLLKDGEVLGSFR